MSADADNDANQRDEERHPIELKVEYQRLNTFFSDYTKNISKGGTFIKTDKPLPVGTEFVFKLFVPKLEEPLRIRGCVEWTVSEQDIASGAHSGDTGMGIHFVYRTDEDRQVIERKVEKLMVDSLGQLLYSKLMEHSRKPEDEG